VVHGYKIVAREKRCTYRREVVMRGNVQRCASRASINRVHVHEIWARHKRKARVQHAQLGRAVERGSTMFILRIQFYEVFAREERCAPAIISARDGVVKSARAVLMLRIPTAELLALHARTDPHRVAGIERGAQLGLVAYIPDAYKNDIDGKAWTEHVLKTQGGKFVKQEGKLCIGKVDANADKGVFPLKIKEPMITEAIAYLKGKGLFPDGGDSDDDELVFGDDDFPE